MQTQNQMNFIVQWSRFLIVCYSRSPSVKLANVFSFKKYDTTDLPSICTITSKCKGVVETTGNFKVSNKVRTLFERFGTALSNRLRMASVKPRAFMYSF